MIEWIAFDADDTLWHNEGFYTQAKAAFVSLLAGYAPPDEIAETLDHTETDNVRVYGYGIKSFILSMVEVAVELSQGQVTGEQVGEILRLAREMLQADLELFEHAQATVAEMAQTHRLMLVTKGDLFEQEAKVARSGLAEYFDQIAIVGDKTPQTYRRLLRQHSISPSHFLMVGNSLRSDIAPVVEIGGWAVYVPYDHTWAHEAVLERPLDESDYLEIEHLGQLPELVAGLAAQSANDRS
jgi:putative hydrolase of the HAD superfamily